ncbi:hypothetical protein O7632_06695 [Solwaraspora sp. WMMD406]|uniref:hypothetical protein n=1 Tax=Solwaraspora sp. WMMD406 TaxID=3016095 RepID=UPI002415DECD|nr:hypothetical protein [Solwaraspora sp. WMMD406]MDG4763797.1 hypothetical protein [Solwaraspora sp. WMMD406]
MTAQYPPPAASAGSDRSTLWGVLGIVVGLLCCGILGVVFGFLSIRDARRFGKSPVLGWVAVVLSVVNIVAGASLYASGNYPIG